jgi:predicted kinase
MSRLILVCGPTGAGKTTYSISISISEDVKAIRISIDPWMQTLFASDMTTLDFTLKELARLFQFLAVRFRSNYVFAMESQR